MKLKTIPQQINLLTNLNRLDLSGNQIKEIPNELGHLMDLQKLYLAYNDLTTLNDEVFDELVLGIFFYFFINYFFY